MTTDSDKLRAAKMALEDAWVSMMAFAGNCWDTLDDIEEAIAAISGETDKTVNARLYAGHKRFIKAQWRAKGTPETRWKHKDELARLQASAKEAPNA